MSGKRASSKLSAVEKLTLNYSLFLLIFFAPMEGNVRFTGMPWKADKRILDLRLVLFKSTLLVLLFAHEERCSNVLFHLTLICNLSPSLNATLLTSATASTVTTSMTDTNPTSTGKHPFHSYTLVFETFLKNVFLWCEKCDPIIILLCPTVYWFVQVQQYIWTVPGWPLTSLNYIWHN